MLCYVNTAGNAPYINRTKFKKKSNQLQFYNNLFLLFSKCDIHAIRGGYVGLTTHGLNSTFFFHINNDYKQE